MLGVDDRRPPARLPLRGALHQPSGVPLEQRLVGRVPERPFPPCGLVEHRAERAFPLVRRADPDGPAGLPLLGRVHDAVHLVEALAGPVADVLRRLLVRVEPGGVRLVHVDGGDLAGHQLGDRAAAARAFLDPARRGRPQALGLGHLAEQRVPVRGHRDQPVDGVPDPGLLVAEQFGHQLERLFQLRVEVFLGERHLGGREHRLLDGRDLVRRDDDRPVRVRADLHVAAVLALVHVGVHVADDRVGDLAVRVGEQRDRADADHLVHGRGEREPGTGHPGDPRRPHAAADDHVVRLDLARAGGHRPDAAAVHRDAVHLGAGQHGERPGLLRALPHQRAGPQRVDHPDGREVRAAQDHRLVQVRHQLVHLTRGDQLGGDAPGLGLAAPPPQLDHPLRGAGHLDAAALREHAELLVLRGAVLGQLEHHPRVLDREDEVGRVAGGAARVRHRSLVHQDEVPPAQLRQVVHEAVADDAGPDDDGAGPPRSISHGGSIPPVVVGRFRCAPGPPAATARPPGAG